MKPIVFHRAAEEELRPEVAWDEHQREGPNGVRTMDRATFKASLTADQPPSGLSLALQALWYAAKGDWNIAHQRAQDDEGRDGSWVHAHLHRVEGDLGNAAYWDRRAGKPIATEPLNAEWEAIVEALLP